MTADRDEGRRMTPRKSKSMASADRANGESDDSDARPGRRGEHGIDDTGAVDTGTTGGGSLPVVTTAPGGAATTSAP